MSYESTRVGDLAGTSSKRHLPVSKGANDSGPRLNHDDTDCCQMCDTKPRISHPGPIQRLPNQDEHQTDNHEHDEQDVPDQKRIGGQYEQETGLQERHLTMISVRR